MKPLTAVHPARLHAGLGNDGVGNWWLGGVFSERVCEGGVGSEGESDSGDAEVAGWGGPDGRWTVSSHRVGRGVMDELSVNLDTQYIPQLFVIYIAVRHDRMPYMA